MTGLDDQEWTILLTIPAGRLRWHPQPFEHDTFDMFNTENEHLLDADAALHEESQRERANNAAFARWIPRLRRLGLIGPPRIPSLPTEFSE